MSSIHFLEHSPSITSLENPKIKLIQKLWNRRDREKQQLFLIEGYRELLRAGNKSQPCEYLLYCKELFLGANENELIHAYYRHGVPLFSCTEKVFRQISYRDRPDGLLAVARQTHLSLDGFESQLTEVKNPFLIVAEAIEKPGNLGTILRSSDAAKVDGLMVCDRCTDIHNPNVLRASVGTLFTVPVVETESLQLLPFLKQRKIAIVAATPSAAQEYTEADLAGPIAILVGTEQYGLSPFWMDNADLKIKIPMLGVADSLNVAMAATLLIYEALRQRTCKKKISFI